MSYKVVPLLLFVLPISIRAQAAIEYVLKSGSSGLSRVTDSALAGCNVDSSMFACLGRAYPKASIVLAGAICLVIVGWLGGVPSPRSR